MSQKGPWLAAPFALALLAVTGFFSVPIGHAQSEDAPQLVDASGDVQYDPLFSGSQEHPYLDIIAGWVRYINVSDAVEFVFKTVSNEGFQSQETQWAFTGEYRFRAFAGPDDVGEFIVQYQVDARQPVYSSVFLWNESVGVGRTDFDHQFELVNETPGYARFVVSRPVLFLQFDRLERFRATMVERFQLGVLEGSIENADNAASDAIIEFRRDRGGFEEGAGENLSNSEAPGTGPVGRTPFPGTMVSYGLLATVSAAWGLRNGRRMRW